MADTENSYNDLIIINLYVLCNKRGIKAFSPKTPEGKNVRFYRKMLNHRRHFLFELPTRNDSEFKYLLEILMKFSKRQHLISPRGSPRGSPRWQFFLNYLFLDIL